MPQQNSEIDSFSPANSESLVCPDCGKTHKAPRLSPRQFARCVRCGSVIARRSSFTSKDLLAFSLAALILWIATLLLPIAAVSKLGLSEKGYLVQLGSSYRENGQMLLGICVDAFALYLPSFIFLALPLINAFRGPEWLLRLCLYAKKWAMPEVFVLSVLVAFTKIGKLADASLEAGFWCLAGATFMALNVLQRIPFPHQRGNSSPNTAWALLVAAAVLLVPANALPFMAVARGPDLQNHTILGGISELVTSGMWGIAAIVFIASILVPFIKLGGLAWLLFLARSHSGNRRAMRSYRILDFIGRWSMLDVFLVAFLACLIDFGKLSSVTPGPAAPAFAAAVVLTVLAVEAFDTRRLFQPDE